MNFSDASNRPVSWWSCLVLHEAELSGLNVRKGPSVVYPGVKKRSSWGNARRRKISHQLLGSFGAPSPTRDTRVYIVTDCTSSPENPVFLSQRTQGKIIGCFWSKSRSECFKRPPTLRTFWSSRNGARRERGPLEMVADFSRIESSLGNAQRCTTFAKNFCKISDISKSVVH
ncbi:uncharacterized protein LOC143378075 [Andrena cerasifolii]|uniref:uncharacterized protein LOC143378075 n=1 Tax=Andrena cerasifolii TaxID=2819439 RepID=UPI0040382A4F